MTIVAIISSPRKGGNSDTIVKSVIDGAKANGKDVKEFRLNGMSNAKGCQACMACKKSVGCVTRDDFAEILEAIRNAEGLIVSSPCYFGDMDGRMKLLWDRFFSFLNGDFSSNVESGKKLVTVVTCGGGLDDANKMADKMEGTLAGMVGFSPIGKIVLPGGNAPNAAASNTDVLTEAKNIGGKF